MPVQAPQWSEYLSCPVCQNEFEASRRAPVSLACGHTICRTCLDSLHRPICPFDQTPIAIEVSRLPVNTALLQLIGGGDVPSEYRQQPDLPAPDKQFYSSSVKCIEELALFLKPSQNSQLSRPMQRKLVTLLNCQLLEVEGRARAARAARSLGERSITELILQHQNPQQLSANLWAAVRNRGCQFLGPAMQEEVLKLVLLALEDGSALSRKVLVMFVVQRLEPHYPQASKTSIGHVVQLLYRASCFKVTKRDGDSSLMQLKEEFRTYDMLRREHDTQIVQIATEAGLRIAPDQWSSLLYGDAAHKSHMQSIIDKLQTPQSFAQSVQELVIALQRTGDPGKLAVLRPQLDILTNIDPSPECGEPGWSTVEEALSAARLVVTGLVKFCALSGYRKAGESFSSQVSRYKTSLCRDLATHGSCPRGNNCTFAHSQQELDHHRRGVRRPRETGHTPSPVSPPPQPPPEDSKVSVSPGGGLPVAQVAPIPRVMPREIPLEAIQVTPLVDQNGAPMIDPATGQPLVATPVVAAQPGLVQAPDGNVYALQAGPGLGAPIHMAALQMAPAMVVAHKSESPKQQTPARDMKHELSPEIASKSLSALRDRKEEILSELGNIVGMSNASYIGDIARQQAAVEDSRYSVEKEEPTSRKQSVVPDTVPAVPSTSSFSMWTSKPLVTMGSLYKHHQQQHDHHQEELGEEEAVEDLPDGICVSKFGPICKNPRIGKPGVETRAVTANIGQATRPTISVRQPLASASPLPEGLVIMQDQQSVLNYDPGWYSEYFIQEGMDSVAMSHLINPPTMPISPLPNPRDANCRLSSQNLTMYAESARIQKELNDLQRRISSLNVTETGQAMKRDRLAFELRYDRERQETETKAV